MIKQFVPHNYTYNSLNEIDKLLYYDSKLEIFSELVLDFCNQLSRSIVAHENLRWNQAFVSLSFWLRKSSLKDIIEKNVTIIDRKGQIVVPLGVVFHVCPSNVDTMVIYSMILSLLSGNKNILRVSSRSLNQNVIDLFEIMNMNLKLDKFCSLANFISIVSYDHNDEISSFISERVQGRVIWGGNTVVQYFKSISQNSLLTDLYFPDRISLSVIKVSKYNALSNEGQDEFVRLFYNDSYTFDQQGCSSPQTIVCVGRDNEIQDFEGSFYDKLSMFAKTNYENNIEAMASLKMNTLVEDAISNNIKSYVRPNNFLVMVKSNGDTLKHSCGAGYFYVKTIQNLIEIRNYVSPITQTLSYFGFEEEELFEIGDSIYEKGVDRIVPIGKALSFDYIWDGANLITKLTKIKSILI